MARLRHRGSLRSVRTEGGRRRLPFLSLSPPTAFAFVRKRFRNGNRRHLWSVKYAELKATARSPAAVRLPPPARDHPPATAHPLPLL